MEDARKIEEALYIIKTHGTNAWLDVTGFPERSEAIVCLETGLSYLIQEEKYEDCSIIRDSINQLKG